MTAGILVACAFTIKAIKDAKDEVVNDPENQGEDLTLAQQGYVQTISAFSSVSIYAVNTSLKFIIRRLSVSERHSSITQLNVSVALKLTVAKFINSSLLLIIINFN